MPRKGKGKADLREKDAGADRVALFQSQFLEDLQYLIEVDPKTALRQLSLVNTIVRDPFTGIGKLKPLGHGNEDVWSRGLTQKHRVVYMVRENRVDFLQGRFHY